MGTLDMPRLGLGVWKLSDDEAERSVGWALEAGYRHIDTAALYRNETGVGKALANASVPREEVYVTTKLLPQQPDAERELHDSLERLGLDHVDLYLVHWPTGAPTKHWDVLQRLHEQGLTKAIGVSNYDAGQLSALVEAADVAPAVNQIPWHPYDHDDAVLEVCEREGIVLEGYSPLGEGGLVDDPGIGEIATRLGVTPAQVLIAWSLHRAVTIPRSRSQERIAENLAALDVTLAPEDVGRIDDLASL